MWRILQLWNYVGETIRKRAIGIAEYRKPKDISEPVVWNRTFQDAFFESEGNKILPFPHTLFWGYFYSFKTVKKGSWVALLHDTVYINNTF